VSEVKQYPSGSGLKSTAKVITAKFLLSGVGGRFSFFYRRGALAFFSFILTTWKRSVFTR
jgi:hypothetical protein